jgi:hypothetical protein
MSMQTIAADCRRLLADPTLSARHRQEARALLARAEAPALSSHEQAILDRLSPPVVESARVEGSSLVLDSRMTETQARARMREIAAGGDAPGVPPDFARIAQTQFHTSPSRQGR